MVLSSSGPGAHRDSSRLDVVLDGISITFGGLERDVRVSLCGCGSEKQLQVSVVTKSGTMEPLAD